MKLIDIVTGAWAIQPSQLLEIQKIYATHLRGEKIDVAAIEARIGRPLANEPKPYQIIDGVAVLPLEGIMAKRANMMMQISGGSSMEIVARELRAAVNDPAVHSIILAIDSPGGTVDGTQSLASAITAARASKPVVALASGTMASAAYWAGSAAQAVYVVDGTTCVGSIGVVATHRDVSASELSQGIKTTEIYAGQYKRIASAYEPLTKAGKQSIQEQVDYTYALFVDAVAKQRGVSAEKVLKDMADGRVFMGQQAIDAGLVDGVATLDELIAKLNQDRSSGQPSRVGAARQTNPIKGNTMTMTREELAAAHPELLQTVLAEGASAERARIQGVEEQLITGHESLIAAMKYDGKSSAGDAAMAVNAAERQARTANAAALASDAPSPVPTAAVSVVLAADSGAPKTRAEIDMAAKAHVLANGGTYAAAVKAVGGH
jgi:capsid assembly protease